MRFKNCTMEYVKNLYMQKVDAEQKKDESRLSELKNTYPELFNANFLMDLLKNEFERIKYGLDNTIEFKMYLFKYH